MCLLTTILSFHPPSFQHFNITPLSQISAPLLSLSPSSVLSVCLPLFLSSVFVLLSACLGQSWQSWSCRNPSTPTPILCLTHPILMGPGCPHCLSKKKRQAKNFHVQWPSFFSFYNLGPAAKTACACRHDNVLRGHGKKKDRILEEYWGLRDGQK